MDAERILRGRRGYSEVLASAHAGYAHEVHARVRHRGEVHLVCVLARERHAFLGLSVRNAQYGRFVAAQGNAAGGRVDELPCRHRVLRPPGPERRPEPCADVRVLGGTRKVADLIDLEQRAGPVGIVPSERLVLQAKYGMHDTRLPLSPFRTGIYKPLRNRPVAGFRCELRALRRIVRLVDTRKGIKKTQHRCRDKNTCRHRTACPPSVIMCFICSVPMLADYSTIPAGTTSSLTCKHHSGSRRNHTIRRRQGSLLHKAAKMKLATQMASHTATRTVMSPQREDGTILRKTVMTSG